MQIPSNIIPKSQKIVLPRDNFPSKISKIITKSDLLENLLFPHP